MKKLALALIAAGSLVSGCVYEEPYRTGPGYHGDRDYRYDRDRDYRGDRDRDARYRYDRDRDGVPNRDDRRPDDPRRY